MAGWRDSAPRQPSEREGFEWVQRPDDGLWYELRVRGPSYLDDPVPAASSELIPSQRQPTIDPQQQLTSPDQVPTGALDAFFSPFTRLKLSDAPKLLASGTASLAREVATSPIPTPGTVQEAAMRFVGNVAQKVNPKANLDVVQQLGEQGQVRDAAFQGLQQDIQSSMSPQMQASLQKNWIDRDAEGNLTWGDADIATLLGQTAQSLPGVAAGVGAGGGAAQVLRAGTKGLFRRAGLERLARAGNTAAESRLKKIDAILDAAGYGLGETSVAAPLAEQQVRDQVNALDMATLRHSPRFMEIYDAAQELGPEERFLYARETLANELGSATGLKVAATTFAAGPIAGPVAGRARQLMTGRVAEAAAHATRGRAANAGVSALEEMGQEFVQSGAEGALQALALREAGVTGDQADPYLQAANQAVGGAAAGALIGGGIGYATGRPGGAASATSPAPGAQAGGTPPGSPPGTPPPGPGGVPEAAAPVDEQVNMATLSALARQAQATEGIDVGAVQQITRAAVRKQITMSEAAQALRDLIAGAGGAPVTDAEGAGAAQATASSEAAAGPDGAPAGAGAAQGEPQTAQPPSPTDTTGLAAMGGNMARGISANLRDALWASYSQGSTVVAGIDDPALRAAKAVGVPADDRAAFEQFLTDYGNEVTGHPEPQTAQRPTRTPEIEAYRAKAKEAFGNETYFSADLAKELDPTYAASNEARMEHNVAAHPGSVRLRDAAFADALAEPAEPGEVVRFTSGGTGSGKSSGSPSSGIIYDSTLANFDAAKKQIDAALESGRDVAIYHTFADPEEAFRRTLTRAKNIGRAVSIAAHANSHRGANETVRKLAETYADDDRVQIKFYDNSGGTPVEITSAPEFDYNGLHGNLRRILDEKHRSGEVDDRHYRAVAGSRARPGDRQEGAPPPAGGERAGSRSDHEPRSPEAPSVLTDGREPTPEEAAQARFSSVSPETAERLAIPGVTEELRRMAPHAGWSETGGRMIRKSEDPDSPDYSTVVGRTKWLPHEPWFAGLPTKLGKDGDYVALVEKALSGAKLTARERRVIEGMVLAAEAAVRENVATDEDLIRADLQAARERVKTPAEEEEYLAYLDEQERAENEWFEREAASARGEAGEPARGAGQPDRLPEQAPAEETPGSDPSREGVGQGADRGTPETAAPRVTPRQPERPASQDRLEFIAGGKKGLEAHILFGRFADSRWGAVSGYQFRTGTMLGRGSPLDDRVPSMADTREEAINGAATILHNWMRGIASNQQADHTPAMREAATALADRLAKQYEIAAPPEAAPAPPAGKAPERDLFGEAPVSKQALADEQRRRDEKRNSGQDSTETGDPSDLFSQARQQADLTDAPASTSTETTEVRENAAVYEGKAAQDPEVRAPRRKVAQRPAEAGRGDVRPAPTVQLDIFANAAGPGPGEQVARAFDRVALVETGRFKTGITAVDDWTAAAHILAPLRKSPQEQFLMLAIDKRRRPLAVLRHTIGLRDSANVDPGTVFGQIASVPNVAKVYFAHNHPSGVIEQSEADHFITDRLSALFRGSGIEVGGMIVVAPGSRKASLYTPGTFGDLDQQIQPAARTDSVPMLERRFTRIQSGKKAVGSPARVKEVLDEVAGGMESGLLLLNSRHHVVGVLPLSVQEMGRLRTDDPRTSHARLFAEASKVNASAAIAVVSEGEEAVNAARNALTALAAGNIRDLDIMQRAENGALTSEAGAGRRTSNDAFYSRSGAAPGFYSQVLRTVENAKQAKAPVLQWTQWLRNQPGVKQEEMDWLGVADWLSQQTGQITREQLADFIRANQIEVEETLHGSPEQSRLQSAERAVIKRATKHEHFTDRGARDYALDAARGDLTEHQQRHISDEMRPLIDELRAAYLARADAPPVERLRFDSDELLTAGGENYRELLLRFAGRPGDRARGKEVFDRYADRLNALFRVIDDRTITGPARDEAMRDLDRLLDEREIAVATAEGRLPEGFAVKRNEHSGRWIIVGPGPLAENQYGSGDTIEDAIASFRGHGHGGHYRSGHWNEPDVLAHVRFNERTDENGNRVLFIDEIQSDWHQEGRKSGYRPSARSTVKDAQQFFGYSDAFWEQLGDEGRRAAFEEMTSGQPHVKGGVPDAPFKTSWPELALKRMIRYAAENGFDRIAWTTGEQQADRYNLSKHLAAVGYAKRGNLYNISAWAKKEGRPLIWHNQSASLDDIERHLGKEIAQRVRDGVGQRQNDYTYLRNLDLKVGGEGMRAFYDKILVDTANRLGKKWGAKVGATKIKADNAPEDIVARHEAIDPNHPFVVKNRLPVHSLDVTDAMREAALAGQPLFSRQERAVTDRRFAKFVDAVATKEVGESANQVLGRTPTVLQALGAADLPLYIEGKVIAKALTEKHGAFFTPEIVKQVAAALYDPVAVLDAASGNGAILVITEVSDRVGNPVSVGIHLNVRGGIPYQVNRIATIHPREEFSNRFAAWVRAGRLRYISDKALDRLPPVSALIGAGTAVDEGQSAQKILRPADVVKRFPGSAVGGNALASRGASAGETASVAQVTEWLSKAIEKTRGAANTHVVADVVALREATGDASIPDDVEGVYFAGGRDIYLVADRLPTRDVALRRFAHEMFGHLALEQYGDIDRVVRMVKNMRRMGSKSIGALWQEVALTQPGLDPVRHAKEVIALMAERGVKNSMIDRLLAWARDLLRSWGIDIEYSDAEVRALIARAARALQEAARVSGADRVRAAKIDAAATEEAALRQLNAMDLADSPLIGSGAPLDAYYTRPAVLDKETLGETDIEALDDAIAAALFETPGPDRERLYSRRAPEDPEITRIRRHVMANAAHEGLPLKDRMRLFITRVTDISGLAMRQAIVNKFQSIAAYERLMNAGKLLDAALSPYKQTVATQNLGSVMSAILHKGIPAWVNGAYTVANDGRKGILEIFAPLVNHPDGNLLPQWELYAAARRASRLIEEGRERLFTHEMIDRSLELEQKYPIFKDVFDDWQTFNTQALDMAQEAGLIDAESRAIWERHDYVPFYRAMESVSGRVNAVSLKKSIANQRARIRTLFGGTSPLEDVFESMLMNTAHLVDASFKNRAAQAIVTAFDGVATTRLPKVVQPTTISADQAMRALRAAGVNLVGQEPSSDYLTLFRRVAPVGKNIVSVMFDGKPQYFEVHDPLLLQSIVEMSPNEWLRQIDLFTFGLLSGSKRLLTRAVTAMPGFIMANYLRDTASNVVQNQNKSVGDMLKLTFITESLKGAVAYIADNPVVAEMMMSGAGGDQVYDNERGNLKRTLMREMSDSAARTRLEEIAGTMVSPRRLWKVYTKVQQASENANRIATYRLVRERGGTHAEAAYQAHDVLNFQQRGAHPAMQLLVMMVPFLNARIQGLDRLARGFTANRMGFMFKGLMLTAVTIALMGLGDDDERYRELPQWDRDANWHLFLGKLHLRIPKPFEVGALFGTVPERMIRLMRGQDRFRDVAQSLVRMVTDTFAFNPVPQAFKPVLEAWAGRSFFTNRPILSIAERNLLPEAQYRPWTSPTLISIAQAMPDAAPAFMRSPLQLEHLIRGYLGGMGMMALEVADRSVRAAGGYYDAPSQSPVDVMLRRFARTGEPRVTRWHDELYRMMDAADEAARTVSKLQGERLFEQAREVAKENRQALLLRPKLNHLAKRMRELNAQLRRVQGSRTLTGDQKRAEIERLNAARNDIARQVEPYAGLF